MRPRIPALGLAFFGLLLLGAALPAVPAAPAPAAGCDLARLAGHWYLVARLPTEAAQGFGAQVDYRIDGGALEEAYAAHDGSLNGPVSEKRVEVRPDPEEPGRWKVSTGWIGSNERLLIYVSPGYRRALVGDANAVWVLAREPEIPEWSYAGLVARLGALGYDTTRIRRVVQKPEQAGRPGFE